MHIDRSIPVSEGRQAHAAHWHRALLLLCLAVGTSIAPLTASANIADNFDRADAAAIGNGWIEKNAAAFVIAGNEAGKPGAGNDYRNNIVYRPASEDVLDVEASIEFRLLSLPAGYPQLMTRIQSATAANNANLDAYLLYVNDSTSQAVLSRQTGSNWDTPLATLSLSPSLNTTDRYRLRMSAMGTSPVQLAAFVERLNGSTWQIIGQANVNDGNAQRIATAGSVGFGGYIETNYRYDNFSRVNLTGGGTNPAPTTTSLAPSSALQGENGLVLTVFGSNFVTGSTVRWNGANRTTTFVSGTELTAAITAADLGTAGTNSVTVFTPTPGGGTSNAQTFTVNSNPTPNPVPTVSSLNPSTATAGTGAFTLTVNGSSFASGAVVRWNGANRTTTFVSSSQLTATIAAADISATGNAAVTVFNPAPGGGVSNSVNFTISAPNNPLPVAGSLSPSSATAGTAGFTLTVNGSNFIASSVIRWNGANRTTTFVSSTQIRASIPATDIASAGSSNVTVFSPSPGGGTSGGLSFTINSSGGGSNPRPAANSLLPGSVLVGSSTIQLTVSGTGFVPSSVIRWNGSNRTTTYVDANTLWTNISSGDLALARINSVTVNSPAPGGGTSLPLTFFVLQNGIGYFFDGFNRADNANLGNGWTEKNPTAYSIVSGAIQSIQTLSGLGYVNDLAYRPQSEDRRDVEVSMEFTRRPELACDGNTYGSYPQVHARVGRSTVATPNRLESYIFFVDDCAPPGPGRALFGIQPATEQFDCQMATVPFSSAMIVGQRYRLRFRVTGTSPVVLTGLVDRFNGESWEAFASGTYVHDSSSQRDSSLYCVSSTIPAPIVNGGAVGFGKWLDPTDIMDNFYWMDLVAQAPAPAITGINPGSATAGAAAFTLTVTGSNFNSQSIVRWNGANRTTTFVSSSELRAAITAADIASAGSAAVTAFAPAGGGQTSNSAAFLINPAASGAGNFTDDFTRANSAVLGNGWIEKSANAFAINANAAQKLAVTSSYRDNIVYRPASEDVRDAEVSVEFRLTSLPVGYPQLFTRIQSSSAAVANFLEGYILFMNDSPTQVILGRQLGSSFETTLSTLTLATPLNTTDLYRMRLSATGSDPVQLAAYIERSDAGSWQILGQTTIMDSSPERISQPGSTGFGGYIEGNYSFDNFQRTNF